MVALMIGICSLYVGYVSGFKYHEMRVGRYYKEREEEMIKEIKGSFGIGIESKKVLATVNK